METPGSTPSYKKMADGRFAFVENIINKKSYEPARAFRDLWSLVMF